MPDPIPTPPNNSNTFPTQPTGESAKPSSIQSSKSFNYLYIFVAILFLVFFIISQVIMGMLIIEKHKGLSFDKIRESLPFINTAKTLPLNNSVQLPIQPSNPAIVQLGVYYFLEGNIVHIKIVNHDLEITTDIKGENIPRFLVTKNTLIYKGNDADNQYTGAIISELKKGQHVRLGVLYTLEDKNWVTTRVTIIQ